MATAPITPNTSNEPKGRTVVTVSVLVGMILIIILLVVVTRSLRPVNGYNLEGIRYANAINRRHASAAEEKQEERKGLSKSTVDLIPVVKYDSVLRVVEVEGGLDEEANAAVRSKGEAPGKSSLRIPNSPKALLTYAEPS